MKIVIAMDSFKGSMTSLEAGLAAKEGVCRVYPDAEVDVVPVADGGEGTVAALTAGMGGTLQTVSVTGPLGTPVQCCYGICPKREDAVAIIEMAGAAGLTLVPENERNPLYTTSYGVGEVIRDAILKGCRRFIIGIGGSATNDGGVGMLQALGFSFLDKNGKEIPHGAIGLSDLAEIKTEGAMKELKTCVFDIACDVTNPLCGENGCSRIFAPQKGADGQMAARMDAWLCRFAGLTKTYFMDNMADIYTGDYPGSGAAGGMGYAFLTYLHGRLESGIKIIMRETKLADRIREADIVLTGEGFLDTQTTMGKAPAGIASLAKQLNKPVIAFAGGVAAELDLSKTDFYGAIPITKDGSRLEEAMQPERAKQNMADTVEQMFRRIETMFPKLSF